MNLSELGKTVAKYAPMLGGALSLVGVPGAAALGSAVAATFGGDIKDPEDLIRRINGDPDAALKLAQLQMQNEKEIRDIQLQYFVEENADRANARQREIEVNKTPADQRDQTPSEISKIFIYGYFLLAILVIAAEWTKSINAEELQPIMQLLKDLGMAVMLILAYWFGASNKKS